MHVTGTEQVTSFLQKLQEFVAKSYATEEIF